MPEQPTTTDRATHDRSLRIDRMLMAADLENSLLGGCPFCDLEYDQMCVGCGQCNCDTHETCVRPTP